MELSIHFQKKVASGLFGGEGFIMQRVSGQGIVFAEFDGHVWLQTMPLSNVASVLRPYFPQSK